MNSRRKGSVEWKRRNGAHSCRELPAPLYLLWRKEWPAAAAEPFSPDFNRDLMKGPWMGWLNAVGQSEELKLGLKGILFFFEKVSGGVIGSRERVERLCRPRLPAPTERRGRATRINQYRWKLARYNEAVGEGQHLNSSKRRMTSDLGYADDLCSYDLQTAGPSHPAVVVSQLMSSILHLRASSFFPHSPSAPSLLPVSCCFR